MQQSESARKGRRKSEADREKRLVGMYNLFPFKSKVIRVSKERPPMAGKQKHNTDTLDVVTQHPITA